MIEIHELIEKRAGTLSNPLVWRTLLALKHKKVGLNAKKLTFLEDNVKIIMDKFMYIGDNEEFSDLSLDVEAITSEPSIVARYLEGKYSGNNVSLELQSFANTLLEYKYIFGPLFYLTMLKFYKDSEAEEQEIRFGIYLKVLTHDKEATRHMIGKMFSTFCERLAKHKFLEDEKATYTDYILFGYLNYSNRFDFCF
ncbi:hypothetical protein K502DRAFT_330574 [Neoconidiobolus thromboides FSU 785]|nr:hypothetical protein K502DRAFT_330574 [Neoconidiobolus thromboides FSU 785]